MTDHPHSAASDPNERPSCRPAVTYSGRCGNVSANCRGEIQNRYGWDEIKKDVLDCRKWYAPPSSRMRTSSSVQCFKGQLGQPKLGPRMNAPALLSRSDGHAQLRLHGQKYGARS